MSRSKRKSPFIPIEGKRSSMKGDKRNANKALRKATKNSLKNIQYGMGEEDYTDLNLEDVSDNWTFSHESYRRIDEDDEEYDKYMRK